MSSAGTFLGRDAECAALSDLVASARAGNGRVLVLRGEAGIGKTALLEFLVEHADGCRVARAAGVESEMELAFAGLHQLCGPLLGGLHELPAPQRDALGTALGRQSGQPPDRLLVGLAVLTLLSDAAEDQPLVCVVDDVQWLDQASTQVLDFVARRLQAERLALVFAMRGTDREPHLAGLPELVVRGLSARDAAALLHSTVPSRLDERVRHRILAESRGHPLALRELPRRMSPAELAFGPGAEPSAEPRAGATLVSRLEEGFQRQAETLPEQSRRLLLLAAAEPVGDVSLLWRAAERLDLDVGTAVAADTTGLVELRHRVEFRHPLVRSAVYRAATPTERREVHAAIAEVTDPAEDPDRRAWHRARGTVGPDEAVADELEASADRARARGGLTAAGAFLATAARLSPDPARRARRSLAAAQIKATAGAFDEARTLLAAARGGPLTEYEQARVELLDAQLALYSQHGNKALPLLLAAARRLEPIDAKLARETYLDALAAAMFAGRLAAGPAIGMEQVARAMREVPLPTVPDKSDQLLSGVAMLFTDGYAAAAPSLHRTLHAFGSDDLTMDEAVRFAWLGACVATDLWDDVSWDLLTRRHLDAIRDVGALSVLPVALNSRAIYDLCSGDLAEAESLVAESRWTAEVTAGQNAMIPYGEVCLRAMRGDAARAEPQFRVMLDEITARGEGVGLNMVSWFQAVLYNSLGRYEEALAAARLGAASPLELGPPKWALAELVEAAARSGHTEQAMSALEELSSFTRASGTAGALGVETGRRALLLVGPAAEDGYREAIERLEPTTLRVELARARLRYGEWLRREGRRVDARDQLRSAHDALTAMGVAGFAQRARLELAAAGETVLQPATRPSGELTPQEADIARLAADGLTNPEIGAALFISPRTVEWHLRKVYTKLGVTTRRQLQSSMLSSLRTAP